MRALLLLIPVVACACKGETAGAPPPSNLFVSVASVEEGRRPPEGFTGTWIDVLPGVEFQKSLVMGSGEAEAGETRLNGHPFALEGEFLVIGPARYGPLPKGTRVEVRNEGVFAEGVLLGALPERIAMPADGK